MDPSTTLVTFLLQTQPAVQSVQLIGSWDNFSSQYPMQRDSRRGQGQWKGCHTFKNIICDNDTTKTRNGGLTMGSTYYYYYEVNGGTETFDNNMPSTTACPYLPGQTVNTLTIPREQTLHHRSISLSSMRITDFKTMDPEAKFISPQPVEEAPIETVTSRLRSAPRLLRTSASTRSLSPAPAWRRLFGNKHRGDEERGRSRGGPRKLVKQNLGEQNLALPSPPVDSRSPSPASSTTSRSRSIPPEELRRFLLDTPSRPTSRLSQNPPMTMSDDIGEENEDDENFAMLAPSETQLERGATGLSPPPFSRVNSSETIPLTMANLNALTVPTVRLHEVEQDVEECETEYHSLDSESHDRTSVFITHNLPSTIASPICTRAPEEEMLTFYDDSNDDEDVPSNHDGEIDNISSTRDEELAQENEVPSGLRKLSIFGSRFSGYSLPQVDELKLKKLESRLTFGGAKSPQLVTDNEEATGSNFLPSPVDTPFCIDEFVTELDWMVNSIGTKNY